MNILKTIVAVTALAGLGTSAQAGLFGSHLGCGASKCCDCADTCAPACRPTIARPCHVNVYNYQRTCAKPFNCCDGCDLNSCCPANNCAPGYAGNNCAPGCVGNACAPACAPVCAAPCGDNCVGNNCVAACDPGCGAPCVDDCCPAVDACELAELIYMSQTACYARQRRRALQILGARYSCVCNPEIMSAFIYGLNDADESVRANAADEIGDQLRKYCCCSPCVVSALTYALADCDWRVRSQAEQALRLCGYDIVDGCCEVACDAGCVGGYCAPAGNGAPVEVNPEAAPVEGGSVLPPAPAPPKEVAPPAAPAAEYFPRTMPEQTVRKSSLKNSLKNLFTLSN